MFGAGASDTVPPVHRSLIVAVSVVVVCASAACSGGTDRSGSADAGSSVSGFRSRAASYLREAAATEVAPAASRDAVWRAVARLAADPTATKRWT